MLAGFKENVLKRISKTKTPIVGIDISSASVKLLELSQTPQGYRVESYAVEHLGQDVMAEREIKNIDAIAEAIAAVVRRSRTKAKCAAIALAGSAVITKTIQINANLKEFELEAQIYAEAERYIPFPLGEVNIDFQIMGPSAKNPDLSDVLLVASRTEIIDALVEALNMGGLTTKVVDVEVYAIERAFQLIQGYSDLSVQQTVAVFDIGASMTLFTVLHDGAIIYNRDQLFGGKQLTEEIQRRYGLSFEEATIAKTQGGLPEDYSLQVMEPFKDNVVQQVSRALQFFYSSSQYSEIQQIVLAGGTAALPGLAQKIEQKIGISTTVANPFVNMSIAPRVSIPALTSDAPSLMTCCGLALRNFIDEHTY